VLLLTCEHGGRRIPAEYRTLFRGAEKVLASHRGWDPGALPLARIVAKRLRLPLLDVEWSRLLVEANRAPTNRRIWSSYTAGLPRSERLQILDKYWWPHRREVEERVAALSARGRRVLHVAVHSFTPVLDGQVRDADIGLLYDPRRPAERAIARRWKAILEELDPSLRVRFNYPYHGAADGLPTWLRKRFPDARYAGYEFELNQAVLSGARGKALAATVAISCQRLLAG